MATDTAEQLASLAPHLAEFKEQGFTVFRGHLPPSTVGAIRAALTPRFEAAFAADPTIGKLKLGRDAQAQAGSEPGGLLGTSTPAAVSAAAAAAAAAAA
eukprot:COSAG04_NODE_16764_length_489_cov_1.843590_1_plen_99_part_00